MLPGYDYTAAAAIKAELAASSIIAHIVGPSAGPIKGSNGSTLKAEFTLENSRSTHFDSIIIVGGESDEYAKKLKSGRMIHAVREAFMHQKAIAVTGNAIGFVTDVCLPGEFEQVQNIKQSEGIEQEKGVLFAKSVGTGAEFMGQYLPALAKHRVWDREIEHIAA